MQKQQFSIRIQAPRERIWSVLWDETSFRDWANNIDEGMYMEGVIKEGNEVHFMSPTGYGVKSLVERLIPNEFVLFRHTADTKDEGLREEEWTGGGESYSLTESDGGTTLTVNMDVPTGQEENFKNILPKALERVKALAEKG